MKYHSFPRTRGRASPTRIGSPGLCWKKVGRQRRPLLIIRAGGLPRATDLLVGTEAIAEYLGLGKRQIDWQIRNGNIPVTRMGRKIIGSKAALRRRFTPPECG
jgi:excisionase family DNA binding protein